MSAAERELKEQKKQAKEQAAYLKGQAKRAAVAVADDEEDAHSVFLKKRTAVCERLLETQAMLNTLSAVRILPTKVTKVHVPPTPIVQCPKCFHGLTPKEVLAGFSADVLDHRTTCPECFERFHCTRTVSSDDVHQRFVWLCPDQTREAYVEWASKMMLGLDPEGRLDMLFTQAPHIAWNAYIYGLEEGHNAREAVASFLEM